MQKTITGLTRRQFLWLTSLTAAGWAVGCAVNPVTGRQQLMLVSESQEISLDKQNSPHQISSDYGAVQDPQLAAYIAGTGTRLAQRTHRPGMPYSFQVVNAAYINAYAFPGGTIAATRAILLKLDNEAELAALLGHELGHVNARHTAEIMSKNMLTSTLVSGLSAYVGAGSALGSVASQLGMLGSGALLAAYSRDNERQADALGLEYLTLAGYGPEGMVGLMEMLNSLSKGESSAASLLFSTHPMSNERYQSALQAVRTTYAGNKGKPIHRERYMDHTARLRGLRGAIEAMEKGETAMGKKSYPAAENLLRSALQQAPGDYAALVMMAKCQLLQDKNREAGTYLSQARQVYPQEAQAHYLGGYAHLQEKQYEAALSAFETYDKRLPGNPNTSFFKGYACEKMNRKPAAAQHYARFLQSVKEGKIAQYARQRLIEWGYAN
jgi:predicted Zn-dependent protease